MAGVFDHIIARRDDAEEVARIAWDDAEYKADAGMIQSPTDLYLRAIAAELRAARIARSVARITGEEQ